MAPAMIAEKSASSSSYDVRMSALSVGSTDRMARQTSMPDPSGRRTSSTATSGCTAGIRLVASSAESDSPTTVTRPLASSMVRMPWRTTSWSSSR